MSLFSTRNQNLSKTPKYEISRKAVWWEKRCVCGRQTDMTKGIAICFSKCLELVTCFYE